MRLENVQPGIIWEFFIKLNPFFEGRMSALRLRYMGRNARELYIDLTSLCPYMNCHCSYPVSTEYLKN